MVQGLRENTQEKKFQRKIEDFTCNHCGFFVSGNGYTNHCPVCLWSQHVDKNPGDRLEVCKGMMEPCGVEKKGNSYLIIHRCVRCQKLQKNRTSSLDDFDVLVSISKKIGK
jgi:hypothetical protein